MQTARIQIVTAAGASFKLENGALVAKSATDAPPRVGEVIEVKTVAIHAMEPGYRKQSDGTVLPRDIIHTFTARFAGVEVFSAKFGPAVSANPYLAFFVKLTGPGDLEFRWQGDKGLDVVERIGFPVA